MVLCVGCDSFGFCAGWMRIRWVQPRWVGTGCKF